MRRFIGMFALAGLLFCTMSYTPLGAVAYQTQATTQDKPVLSYQQFLPDPKLTPGDYDPTVTIEQVQKPGYLEPRRNVPESLKRQVFKLYGIANPKP